MVQWASRQYGFAFHLCIIPTILFNDINDLFLLVTTKEEVRQIQYNPLFQVDRMYELTWNELPLLVFEVSDCNRRSRPFGVTLVYKDENSMCCKYSSNFLQSSNIQLFHQSY